MYKRQEQTIATAMVYLTSVKPLVATVTETASSTFAKLSPTVMLMVSQTAKPLLAEPLTATKMVFLTFAPVGLVSPIPSRMLKPWMLIAP